MDTVGKLNLIGAHMGLEPAEDADAIQRPMGPGAPQLGFTANPLQRAPCGHSPVELRRAYVAGVTDVLT
jgi:hypothetical protein